MEILIAALYLAPVVGIILTVVILGALAFLSFQGAREWLAHRAHGRTLASKPAPAGATR